MMGYVLNYEKCDTFIDNRTHTGDARNVIPLIVHVTRFYYYKRI